MLKDDTQGDLSAAERKLQWWELHKIIVVLKENWIVVGVTQIYTCDKIANVNFLPTLDIVL